jgi:hypothetical protein
VFAKGAIVTANVTMTGTGRVTLAGVTKGVTAKLEGISSLFVDAATGARTTGHGSAKSACGVKQRMPYIGCCWQALSAKRPGRECMSQKASSRLSAALLEGFVLLCATCDCLACSLKAGVGWCGCSSPP